MRGFRQALQPILIAYLAGSPLTAATQVLDRPDSMPVCANPQQISPAQPLGGGHGYSEPSSMAWNGSEFAVVWSENTGNYPNKFRRFFSDGTPAGPIFQLSASGGGLSPDIVSNGTGYGVIWSEYVGTSFQIMFARLNADGSLIGTPIRVSFYGSTPTGDSFASKLAWSGNGYVVVWEDDRNYSSSAYDIYLTELDATGNVAAGGTRHDLLVSSAANTQANPVIVWSSLAGQYQIFWQDFRSITKYEIWGASLRPLGPVGNFGSATVSGSADSQSPTLVDTGAGMGLSWSDTRDGNSEIYFARLNDLGTKIGADLRVTNDTFGSSSPFLVWTGAEFGVFWADGRPSGANSLWFQRINGSGSLVGLNQQISTTGLRNPTAAFGKHGYLLEGMSVITPYNGLIIPWGCGSDSTPPSCPGNFFSYSVTGTTASVSWSPSGDNESDLAYYQVYRNNVPVARTSSAWYNDSGLTLSTVYNYMIQPVNAWQLQNYTCTSAIYLTTNSSLTLTVNKSNPDAVLNWTDAGLSGYNLYRGGDPRIMEPIGHSTNLTASDASALGTPNSYFYSVDE